MVQHFIEAQEDVYETALSKIQPGHKRPRCKLVVFPSRLNALRRYTTSMLY